MGERIPDDLQDDAVNRVMAAHKATGRKTKGFRFHVTRKLFDGELYEVTYLEFGEEDYDYVYYDNVNFPDRPVLVEKLEDLVNIITDVTLHNKEGTARRILHYIAQHVTTTSIIALVFVLLIAWLSVTGKGQPIEQKLWENPALNRRIFFWD